MKFSLASVAFLTISPTAMALTSCLGAMTSMSKVPGLFIEHMRIEACEAGCQPNMNHWSHQVKAGILSGIVADGARYMGVNDEKGQADFITFIDRLYSTVEEKCMEHMGDMHLCHDAERIQPVIDCVNRHSYSAVTSNLGVVRSSMSNKRCKKASEYFESDQLWQTDFPRHIKSYVGQCHEL
ncbi:hypothetical protein FE257_011422 [Aspergillus nanangensis]|uniref:Uncharacterized protein n=1 Tax=Aspergillus nanangensis TaxID=2582783 RepID=A0AAD4CHD9_ASPNN|nr:hypothetical protein FE257_011422 [Aspergillus nanangensis]